MTDKPRHINLSGHAIDRASQRLWMRWSASREIDEGLHSWLQRMADKAWLCGTRRKDGNIEHFGVIFSIHEMGKTLTLKSVMLP